MALITAMLPGAMWKQAWAFLLFAFSTSANRVRSVGLIGRQGRYGVMLDDLVAAAVTLLILAAMDSRL